MKPNLQITENEPLRLAAVTSSAVFNTHWKNVTAHFPDGYFDYVVDDVPYGINVGKMAFLTERKTFVKQKNGNKLNPRKSKKAYSLKEWDLMPPGQDYFDEMRRISKHQIIFGVEYVDWTGLGTGRIKWNKGVAAGMSFKDYEMAYCSSIDYTHEIDLLWSGMQQAESLKFPMRQQGNKRLNEKRIHPCQKPILIYKKIALDFDLKDKKVFAVIMDQAAIELLFSTFANNLLQPKLISSILPIRKTDLKISVLL